MFRFFPNSSNADVGNVVFKSVLAAMVLVVLAYTGLQTRKYLRRQVRNFPENIFLRIKLIWNFADDYFQDDGPCGQPGHAGGQLLPGIQGPTRRTERMDIQGRNSFSLDLFGL